MQKSPQQKHHYESDTKHGSHNRNSTSKLPVRYLTPPKLGDAHILKRVLCYRPTRHQGPNLSIDMNRLLDNPSHPICLIHNYGHGGAGWTLGPGTANYIVNQLQDKGVTSRINISKNSPISIIGAGCSSYFTCCELLLSGYTNITIIADRWTDLTSHNAGGLLAPVSLPIDDPIRPQLISSLCIDAYHYYKSIVDGKHPIFNKDAANMISVYVNEGSDHGMHNYIGTVMQPAQLVLIDFKNGVRHRMEVFDDSIFMNTRSLMQQMQHYIGQKEQQGYIKKEIRKLYSFDEIHHSHIIINCSALGSRELNQDREIRPTQGHLIHLQYQPTPQELHYLVSIIPHERTKTKLGYINKPSMYYHPKVVDEKGNVGVIGGTFIEGATEQQPHEEEFDTMMERARLFFYGEQINSPNNKNQKVIQAKL